MPDHKPTKHRRKDHSEDLSQMIYGKVPPQAREMEEAVLGALMIERDAIHEVQDILISEAFYVDAHKEIYAAILELHNASYPFDLFTVSEKLRSQGKLEGIGGAFRLSELTNVVSSSANARYHAAIIRQKYIQREHIRIANDIIKTMYEDLDDVFEASDRFTSELLSAANVDATRIKSVRQIQAEINRSVAAGKPIADNYKLGIAGIDVLSKTFNLIGGYPGTGKTAFMLTASRNLARNGTPVGIFSIEMQNAMLVARMLQSETGVSGKRIITGDLEDWQKEKVMEAEPLPDNIYTDDSPYINNRNIVAKIKAFVMKFGIRVLWIDYYQMVQLANEGKLEVRVIEEMSRNLQNLAKELNICIIALSQLTKSQDRPTLNNIRNGGAEQAASDIFILYDENSQSNNSTAWKDIPEERRGKIELIYAKGRYSSVEPAWLYFDKPRQRMMAWDERTDERPQFVPISSLDEPTPTQGFDIF